MMLSIVIGCGNGLDLDSIGLVDESSIDLTDRFLLSVYLQ
jgi:hypothetical protein